MTLRRIFYWPSGRSPFVIPPALWREHYADAAKLLTLVRNDWVASLASPMRSSSNCASAQTPAQLPAALTETKNKYCVPSCSNEDGCLHTDDDIACPMHKSASF